MLIDKPLVKSYLRLDPDDTSEDTILDLMISNAEIYIERAGIKLVDGDTKQISQAKLLSLILVSDYYENRTLDGTVSQKISYTVKSMINQLKYTPVTVPIITESGGTA